MDASRFFFFFSSLLLLVLALVLIFVLVVAVVVLMLRLQMLLFVALCFFAFTGHALCRSLSFGFMLVILCCFDFCSSQRGCSVALWDATRGCDVGGGGGGGRAKDAGSTSPSLLGKSTSMC